jgi:hypothetical protein
MKEPWIQPSCHPYQNYKCARRKTNSWHDSTAMSAVTNLYICNFMSCHTLYIPCGHYWIHERQKVCKLQKKKIHIKVWPPIYHQFLFLLPISLSLVCSTWLRPPHTSPPTVRNNYHLKQFSQQLILFNYPEDDGSMLCLNLGNKSPTSTSSCPRTLTMLWKHQITQSLNG